MWNYDTYLNNTALYDDQGKYISYQALREEEQAIINVVNGRCLVFILCKNMIGSVIGYSAFINGGIVPVLLNADMEKELLDNLISTYKPVYLWVPHEKKNDFIFYEEKYSAWYYSLLKTGFEVQYELNPQLCLLLSTSGSTGSPKFVRQSYNNVEVNAKSIVEYLHLDATERPIMTLPMNYTYGLSIINSHFMVGATLLVTDKGIMQREFWDFFKQQKATSFGGVPYTYEMLNRLRFFTMELPDLRYMTQAGGKLTMELHKKFAEYAAENKKKFFIMYGQCEATARMGYLPAENAIKKCGSMGIAIPGGKFHLVDINGDVIKKANVVGELVYEGANVTLGYAECGQDLLKDDERGGVLQTGDMAEFDEDGYYYIVGRKKRFLKIFGHRVNLDEIDRMIKGKFDDLEVASSGVDDQLNVFVTDKNMADEVKKFVVSKTKLNSAAFRMIIIDEIPKNDAGKILYQELEAYYK